MKYLLLLAALLLVGCRGEGEWVTEERQLGYRGIARVNPYLAAERYLNANGWFAQSSRVWPDYDPQIDTIVVPASFLSTKGLGIRALEWIEDGGMLVITMKGGEPEINDFTRGDYFSTTDEDEIVGLDHIFEATGVTVKNETWSDSKQDLNSGHLKAGWHIANFGITDDGEAANYDIEFEGPIGLTVDAGTSWEEHANRSSRMITTYYGSGELMVLSHARALRNAYIDRADHAVFLEQMASWNGQGGIMFLYGSGTSLFDLIWQHAWQLVIASILLLAFWLWMRIPRFGPIVPDAGVAKTQYGDELKAAARFLWRRKQLDHYIRPLRARIENENEGDPETFYQRLSEQSSLSKEEVVDAMTSTETKDAATLSRLVHKLQALLK